jgi:hypothetical protein
MRRAFLVVALVSGVVGCSTMKSSKHAGTAPPEPAPVPVVVPTVPPRTPLPEGAAPLPTRPVRNPNAAKEKAEGKSIGPVVTFAGVARADGVLTEPIGKNAQGIPIYRHPVGSGFMVVVEGKPGISNVEVGRSIFRYDPTDPTQRPDLEVEVNRPLGDGSAAVCDARRPKIGGVPAVEPPSFAESPKVTAALNDMACRFETFIESNASCTVNKFGDFSFAKPAESKVQYCMVVARAWAFPDGDTLVSVRLRDTDGNPGPVSHFVLQRKALPTQPRRPSPTPTPTAPRRRP